MCLITKEKKYLKSKTDVICYKIMLKKGEELISPYRLMHMKRGVKIVALGDEEIRSTFNYSYNCDTIEIGNGFIHSYIDYNAALYNVSTIISIANKYFNTNVVICRCRIPSKTLFYRDNKFFNEYASKSIIIDDIIEINEGTARIHT